MRLLFIVNFSLNGTFVAAQSDSFYYGGDLSYVNQMEDCGADYKRGGVSDDQYKIFSDVGTNLVRVWLWVDPSWWQEPLDQPGGVKPVYNNLEDVKEAIQRAKAQGMEAMLGLHYSDFWADPGRQLIPRAWIYIANDPEALADSVYHYTKDVLTGLENEGLMPEFVKVGNENNGGILSQVPEENGFEVLETIASGTDWERNALLFNAGIQAVRDVGEIAAINPKIVLHWSNLDGVEWWYQQMINVGVTDFDVIGFSYYYAWHGGSISQLETTVQNLVQQFPDYKVMAVETGYLWSDEYGGIIIEPDPEYLPVIPGKQLEYMEDYTRAVMRGGEAGVIFWEPAWIDTPCKTPWGINSSHTHVAFFDPVTTNFIDDGGGTWSNREYYDNLDAPKAIFKVDMSGREISDEGVFVTGDFTGDDEWRLKRMSDEGNGIYSCFTYLPQNSEGAFYFLSGKDWDARETVPTECADRWETDREYVMDQQESVFAYKWGSCEQLYAGNDVDVIFKVDMADSGVDVSDGVYMTGELTDCSIEPMSHEENQIYSWQTTMAEGSEGAYYYLTTDDWENYQDYRETVPEACADWYGSNSGYVIPEEDVEIGFKWGTCQEIEINTTTGLDREKPQAVKLHQNFPNPFNPSTVITYQLQEMSSVRLSVYDMTGRKVAGLVENETHPNGIHSVNFYALSLASGMYIYRLKAGGTTRNRKLLLII